MKRKPPHGNVRRVASINGNIRGVTTNKCGRLVQYESEQERKLILLLERDPSVTDFASQPEKIEYHDSLGKRRRYTPDFKVWRSNGGIELHEVSVESRGTRANQRERELAANQVCEARRWRFQIHTDRTLPAGAVYANLDFLSMFRGADCTTATMQSWWRGKLQPVVAMKPLQALVSVSDVIERRQLLAAMYYLLWHHVLEMDWEELLVARGKLRQGAMIWLPTEAQP